MQECSLSVIRVYLEICVQTWSAQEREKLTTKALQNACSRLSVLCAGLNNGSHPELLQSITSSCDLSRIIAYYRSLLFLRNYLEIEMDRQYWIS